MRNRFLLHPAAAAVSLSFELRDAVRDDREEQGGVHGDGAGGDRSNGNSRGSRADDRSVEAGFSDGSLRGHQRRDSPLRRQWRHRSHEEQQHRSRYGRGSDQSRRHRPDRRAPGTIRRTVRTRTRVRRQNRRPKRKIGIDVYEAIIGAIETK